MIKNENCIISYTKELIKSNESYLLSFSKTLKKQISLEDFINSLVLIEDYKDILIEIINTRGIEVLVSKPTEINCGIKHKLTSTENYNNIQLLHVEHKGMIFENNIVMTYVNDIICVYNGLMHSNRAYKLNLNLKLKDNLKQILALENYIKLDFSEEENHLIDRWNTNNSNVS